MSIVRNWRILLWLFFVLAALVLISPNPFPKGYVVTGLDRNSVTGIESGDIIYKINDEEATPENLADFYQGIIKLQTDKGVKFARANGTLGLIFEPVQPTKLKFGLDLKGGVRAVLEPNISTNATIEQIISTLETRINLYGLREAVFRPVYHQDRGFVEVSIAGGTTEELRSLLENQGKFDAKIPLRLRVVGGLTSLALDRTYQINVANNSLALEESVYRIGDSFRLSGIDFVVSEIGSSTINLTSAVFSSEDIIIVFLTSDKMPPPTLSGDAWAWQFSVQLSKEGAQKFAYVTQNSNTLPGGYLESMIDFYLDDTKLDSLSISSSLRGKAETEISISGSASNLEEAVKERSRLQSILRSGALPTTVQIVQLDAISPTLGFDFLNNAVIAAALAFLGVIVIVSLRYRKPKLVLPMIVVSVTEMMIVAGFAAALGWTIDLAAIAGLIASVGTGISDQIIILDRALRKEEEQYETLKEKIKKAFFVVFGTAGTVIAAMLPLLFTGFGILRGFALITIIGVLVGILITRPAYGAILEILKKD